MLVLTLLHAAAAILLAVYGANSLLLTALYVRRRRITETEPPPPAHWPAVTVQLPVFNELHVTERLLAAVARLEYPRDRLQIQVLDDSTDETTAIAAAGVERYRLQGLEIQHLRRSERPGFKAGALAAALPQATGEFIAIFDADFIPKSDFLIDTLPYFTNPKIGVVQTRWGHINKDYSLLTRLQAFGLDAHFSIEQGARKASGSFINFNGTCGVWRKSCIENSGGWSSDTLTEDLDLSYRAQMKGWKFKYLVNFTSPAELPSDIFALKSQQFRWTKGAIETAKKIFPVVLKSDM